MATTANESIIGSLQKLFAVMEFSPRRAVDPTDFITKLGLDPQVQQDAQEFSKLFISLLEGDCNGHSANLKGPSNQSVLPSMVKDQFCGKYEYVTKCCACNRMSKRPTSFYELDLTLQGQKTLADCMDDFLHVEKIEGDNQYYCEGCQSKQDANRFVQLKSLPKVLNLQLNRFIYDMQTGRKKKLNSFVQFPEEVDMSQYLKEDTSQPNNCNDLNNSSYVLTGVLMHVGSDANHGHYVAHIKDATTGHWFKFSDTQVETLEKQGDKSQVNSSSSDTNASCGVPKRARKRKNIKSKPSIVNETTESNNALSSCNKLATKIPKKLLKSNSAYMLVYSSKDWLEATCKDEKENSRMRRIVEHLADRSLSPERRNGEVDKITQKWKETPSYTSKLSADDIPETTQIRSVKSICLKEIGLTTETAKLSSNNFVARKDNNIFSFLKPLSNVSEQKEKNDCGELAKSDEKERVSLIKSKSDTEVISQATNWKRTPKNEQCGKCDACKRLPCGQCVACLDTPNNAQSENHSVCILNQCQNLSKPNFNTNFNRVKYGSAMNANPLCSKTDKTAVPTLGAKVGNGVLSNGDKKRPSRKKSTDTCPEIIISNYPKEYQYTNGSVYPLDFPIHLKDYVEEDKKLFNEQLTEKKMSLKADKNKTAVLEERLKNICQKMIYKTEYPETEHSCIDENASDETKKFEFVPKKSVSQFLESSSAVESHISIDNSTYLCAHGKLDVDLLSELQIVTEDAANEMFQCDRLRLNKDLLCRSCVTNRCRLRKLAIRLSKDGKEIAELMKCSPLKCSKLNTAKSPISGECVLSDDSSIQTDIYYWVGKTSLKKWKGMAKDKLHQEVAAEVGLILSPSKLKNIDSRCLKTNGKDNLACNEDDCTSTTYDNESPINGDTSKPADVASSLKSDELNDIQTTDSNSKSENIIYGLIDCQSFNEDITCKHGNLCPDIESKGRPVSDDVWNKFLYYFGKDCPNFTMESKVCSLCTDDAKSEAVVSEEKKERAMQQKAALIDIFNERNRPTWSKSSINVVYLISRNFVESWRYFVRNPTNRDVIEMVGNASLLCEHDLLSYPLKLDTESDYESVVYMVSEDEWSSIRRLFQIDKEICVKRNRGYFHSSNLSKTPNSNGDTLHQELLSSEPKVCIECVEKRSYEDMKERLTYTNAPIYVRKLTGSEKCNDSDFPGDGVDISSKPVDTNTEAWNEELSSIAEENDHPPIKRKKSDENVDEIQVQSSYPSKKIAASFSNDLIRRSNRRQKVRGEKEYFVDSSMLLRDLKVKIMETYKVAPFDQNLWVHGKYLTDPMKTLGQLQILPKSLIYLRADEPNLPGTANCLNAVEDTSWVVPQHDPQEGFKGRYIGSHLLRLCVK